LNVEEEAFGRRRKIEKRVSETPVEMRRTLPDASSGGVPFGETEDV